MQKKTPPGANWREGQRQADGNILSHPANPCPHSPNCRETWRLIPDAEAAECGHCYQRLECSDLARMLAQPVTP